MENPKGVIISLKKYNKGKQALATHAVKTRKQVIIMTLFVFHVFTLCRYSRKPLCKPSSRILSSV